MNNLHIKHVNIVILILSATHLFFLAADPDSLVDIHTRGAWTDEGLYSIQARNFIQQGSFGLTENTTMIRGPLYNLLQVPFFLIFGDTLQVARLVTIFGVVAAFLLLTSQKKYLLLWATLFIIAFTQFHVYQFSHYAMPEITAICMVLASLYYVLLFFEKGKKKYLMYASLMIFIAYGLKIQFVYLVALLPVVFFVLFLSKVFAGADGRRKSFYTFSVVTGYAFGFFVLYLLLWYLPNKSFYNLVMINESSDRFEAWGGILERINFNFRYYLLSPPLYPVLFMFVTGMLALLILIVKKVKIPNQYTMVLLFATVWVLLESHKLALIYLPQRYLLGLYVATSLLAAVLLVVISHERKAVQTVLMFVLVIALACNTVFNVRAFQRRTFDLKTVNSYMKRYNSDGKVIAGVWAPSLTWNTPAHVVPVWSTYFDKEAFFEKYQPMMIITEANEAESEQAFGRFGIRLDSLADSSRMFSVWRYQLKINWLPHYQ